MMLSRFCYPVFSTELPNAAAAYMLLAEDIISGIFTETIVSSAANDHFFLSGLNFHPRIQWN